MLAAAMCCRSPARCKVKVTHGQTDGYTANKETMNIIVRSRFAFTAFVQPGDYSPPGSYV